MPSEAFRRTWVILLLVGWFLFNGAVLLVPSIPVQSVHEDVVALSRLDHAWLLFAHPEWIWEQWTNGLSRIELMDRLPPVLWSIACAAIYTALGAWGGRRMDLARITNESRIARVLFCFLLGYCGTGTLISVAYFVFPNQTLLATVLAVAFVLVVGATGTRGCRLPGDSPLRTDQTSDQQDWSQISWKRRLTGLFFAASGLLLFVQSLGAWLPTLDSEVKRDRWAQNYSVLSESPDTGWGSRGTRGSWAGLEDIAMLWVIAREPARREEIGNAVSEEPADPVATQSELRGIIRSRYLPAISGKWLASLAFSAAVMLVAIRIASSRGVLVAITALFFLISFPSWMELIRLGRPEVIAGAACLGIVYVWLHPFRSEEKRSFCGRAIATMCFIAPLGWWLVYTLQIPSDSQYSVASATLRFLGFSFLYSIPWAATCLWGWLREGFVGAKSLRESRWGGISVLAFLLFGVVLSQPDRVWIPFSVFLMAAFAVGAQSLLSMRGGWLWLLVWGSLGAGSFVNVLVQPGWDNRLLGSLDRLLFEEHVEPEGRNDKLGSYGYSREILRQTIAGELPVDGNLLLIGHWDGLDIPQRTIVQRVQSYRLAPWTRESLQRQRITHIALIDSSELGFSEWDDMLERDYRIQLAELEGKGLISRIPVSDRSRDLTLFQVNP